MDKKSKSYFNLENLIKNDKNEPNLQFVEQ